MTKNSINSDAEQSNKRSCWQLYAKGESINGWPFKIRSKAIFTDSEEARRYIEEFKEKCYDKSHFDYAIEGTLVVSLVELELYG